MRALTLIAAHFALIATIAAPAQTVSALSSPPSREEFDQLRAQAATAVQPADLSAATASNLVAMQGLACSPGNTTPQAESVVAAIGTATACLRSDAKLPRITRAGMATTTDSSGAWAITWAAPLSTAPVTLPLPLNTGTQPIVCNVATSTATGATGRCWLARTLPATLVTLAALVNFDPNAAPASNIGVQVVALPPTQ